MNVLVFKTDIRFDHELRIVGSAMNTVPFIKDWSVDTEDVDRVLRVVSEGLLFEQDIISLMRSKGFHCEELLD